MEPFLRHLGLANKAGKIITGEDHILQHVRNQKVNLVIVATDASDNTKKKYKDKCSFYNVTYLEYGTTDALSYAINKINRVAIAISDAGFAKGLLAKLSK